MSYTFVVIDCVIEINSTKIAISYDAKKDGVIIAPKKDIGIGIFVPLAEVIRLLATAPREEDSEGNDCINIDHNLIPVDFLGEFLVIIHDLRRISHEE
tara:strand:- start:197 stop:490 length:294 start_codon:yes stop_codon:yes gene_type:complete